MSSLDAPPDMAGTNGATPPPVGPRQVRTFLRVPVTDLAVLLAVGAVYVAVMTYLGLLRFDDFFTTNWDLGINQQMLWTTSHGHLLYETGDAEFYDVRSFLQVHSTFVALLVVPLYDVAPVPSTLFILQGSVFFASAFPLYLLARRVVQSRILVLCTIGLYLTSFAVLAGLLYDFHWEAFVPLEFLSFFYLVVCRKLRWSLVPLVAGVLTLEVFPFLAGGVAVFLLYEELEKAGFRWRVAARTRETRWAAVFLVAMAAAYVFFRLVQYLVIPHVVGYLGQPSAVSNAIGSPFAIGVSVTTLHFSTFYWLLLLASLAFLPLLAPKHLILTIPWFVFSVILTPMFSSYFGDQYSFLAVATLVVAAVYGIGRVERTGLTTWPGLVAVGVLLVSGVAVIVAAATVSPQLLSARVGVVTVAVLAVPTVATIVTFYLVSGKHDAAEPRPPEPGPGRWRPRHGRRAVILVVLSCFVAFNLIMSPLNVTNFTATPYPGYWLRYDQNPASAQVEWLAGFIPANAVVLASDFLFTYVANDVNAWSLPWFPVVPGQLPPYFPFSATNLPRYVLIDTYDWNDLPTSIGKQVFNSTTYGLVAFVYGIAYPGTIYLFELGFRGQTAARSITIPPSTEIFSGGAFDIGASGLRATSNLSLLGSVIQSNDVPNADYVQSCMWFGPYVTLFPGTYTLTANLTGSVLPTGNPSSPILTMNGGSWFLPPLYNFSVYPIELNSSGWSTLTWHLNVTAPYPLMEFRGYLSYRNGMANGRVTLNYIEVTLG